MALRQLAANAARHGLSVRSQPALGSNFSYAQGTLQRLFATVVDGLKYQDSHEWTKFEGDTATVGLSDFAQAELGDIVYVELPEVGSEVSQKEQFATVESVKAASDVFSPVSGEVLEVNQALVEDPEQINHSPFEDGWIMKVKVSGDTDKSKLMDASEYEKKCESDDH